MVAITTLTASSPPLHTGGSATRELKPAHADRAGSSEMPATIVTVSDQAQMLLAETRAAQAAADIFQIANGTAAHGAAAAGRPQVVVAHDAQTNEGLYLVWSG
jgi:hypothetical protein